MVEFFCVFFAFIFYFRFYADEPAACLPRLCPTVEAGTPPRLPPAELQKLLHIGNNML